MKASNVFLKKNTKTHDPLAQYTAQRKMFILEQNFYF